MHSVSLNQANMYINSVNRTTSPVNVQKNAPVNHPSPQVSFGAAPVQLTQVRTKLVTPEEKQKYAQVSSQLDIRSKVKLDTLLRNGKLLNNDSNDKSTTLDNLHKMVSNPRFDGLSTKVVLAETITALENPYTITQRLGDIPESYEKEVMVNAKMKHPENKANDAENKKEQESIEIPQDGRSNSCVSASIEFCLAAKMPAEFARFAQGLTSNNFEVEKVIDLKNLTNKTLDSIWLLNNFEIPYELIGKDKAKLALMPDKNAIIRAKIQNSNKDEGERSLIDALMQSTFMNIGSQQSYDSLTDTRGGKFSQKNTGLIEFEKTFTESIVENKNKTSITYQIIDDNDVLVGYTTPYANIKNHIDSTLKTGEAIIVGCTLIDDQKNICGGHEITIIGKFKDKDGIDYYVCNDTDDNVSEPIVAPAEALLPMIHHAGLPQKIVENDITTKDTWQESLENYKLSKSQEK